MTRDNLPVCGRIGRTAEKGPEVHPVVGATGPGASQFDGGTDMPIIHNPCAQRPPTRAEKHRAINNRPKRCPQCGIQMQAGNIARHIKRGCPDRPGPRPGTTYTRRGTS